MTHTINYYFNNENNFINQILYLQFDVGDNFILYSGEQGFK